ncbi:uncharacterized protein F5147DRAFT_774086 [Suillus discolor]|uniref:Uncharacterized protein n=1 Tax=Suillus discolor TaxID=1912936 RepID=A0A9P7F721_9AGAM|nr:uncharacterized protein F5147DRAFT_774086 [Suillus discolor]KAG2107641.1 hypothetical protein F5147DRAFT_774086 [Suillus discolor]
MSHKFDLPYLTPHCNSIITLKPQPSPSMCDAMYSLMNIFAGQAAFIFIHCGSQCTAQFHVVPSADIRDSPSRSSTHHPSVTVLVVARGIFVHSALLARVVHSIAYDPAVHIVCVEGLALAELLASDARLTLAINHSEGHLENISHYMDPQTRLILDFPPMT